jgi:hypothetical protein
MNVQDSVFIRLLKKHTDIDRTFIDAFFKKFKIGGELDFDIKDSKIAKYLGITLDHLRKRLSNDYSKTNKYIKNVDFVKIKTGKTSGITYMVNYQCFEKLAMSGNSKKSESIRLYFIKLRRFIFENQEVIHQAMFNKDKLKLYEGYESIYFFVIDKRKPNILKLGRTKDIVRRLRNYNVGRIDEVDLKYYAIVKNNLLIENCIKNLLKKQKRQVYENREIFEIEPKLIKQTINNCYCKNVSKKQHDELYKELSDLLGVYSYTKDKVYIKPYVIISKNIQY